MGYNSRLIFERIFARPSYEFLWPGSQPLIISPHPDDEIIGCGGTLIKHLRLGNEAAVVYLTNGERGGRDPLITGQVRKMEAGY